jgi:Fe-S-cluster containining protein
MTGSKTDERAVPLKPFVDELKQHLIKTTAENLKAQRTPKQLRAVADTSLEAFGSTIAGIENISPPDKPLACRKGCAHCCHLTVLTDGATALRVATYVREHFSPADRMLLDMRLIVYEEKVEKMTQSRRSLERIPCPLLVDGVCSVHPVRPLVCRAFNSYDAEECRTNIHGGGSTTEIPAWSIPWLLGLALDGGLKDALLEAGYADGSVELGLALKAALDHPHAEERWLAGDRLFSRAAWSSSKP